MKIKDLENKKKKIQEELKKVDTELKNRKALCIGDYGYKKIGKGKDSYNISYLVIKEDDDVKNFKRYGNTYDDLKKMDDESFNYSYDDGYEVTDIWGKKYNSKIQVKCYNKNKFSIELSYTENENCGKMSQTLDINKDNLYDFVLRAKYLLLREHGEEYRIKRKKGKKIKNKFEIMDI